MGNPETPESIKEHQHKYKEGAWHGYSLFELGSFVHLLVKRALHRSIFAKAEKDLTDAQNYLNMMQANINAAWERLRKGDG